MDPNRNNPCIERVTPLNTQNYSFRNEEPTRVPDTNSIPTTGDTSVHESMSNYDSPPGCMCTSKKVEDELTDIAHRVRHREDNIQYLKSRINKLDDEIAKCNVALGNVSSSNAPVPTSSSGLFQAQNRNALETQLKETTWKKNWCMEDLEREQKLLDQAKSAFELKKTEFLTVLESDSPYEDQVGCASTPR